VTRDLESRRTRPRSQTLWRLAVSAGVLVAVWVVFDPTALTRQLAGVRWTTATPAIVGLVVAQTVACAGWRRILHTITGLHVPWGLALPAYYESVTVGALTPANIGGDVYRASLARALGSAWSDAISLTVVHRLSSYLAAVVLGALGLTVLFPHSLGAVPFVLFGVVVTAGMAAFVHRTGRPRLFVVLPFVRTPLTFAFARMQRRAFAYGTFWGLLFHGLSLLLSYVLLLSVDPAAPPRALAALATARLAALLPVSISGIGVQEGSAALLLPLAGVPASAAIAASLLSRLALIGTMVTGVGASVARQRSRPSSLEVDDLAA
jgi:uncharacterized membrane protein YbhN (UPF0104 family)